MKKAATVFLILSGVSIGHSVAQNFASTSRSVYREEIEKTEKNTRHAKEAEKTFSFYSYKLEERLDKLPVTALENHFLGEAAARRNCLFLQEYKQKVPITPGSQTMKTVYRKPTLVKAVKKIESQLKKDLKKKVRTTKEAEKIYNKTLGIAINVVSEDTNDFEKAIKRTKETSDLITLFLTTELQAY